VGNEVQILDRDRGYTKKQREYLAKMSVTENRHKENEGNIQDHRDDREKLNPRGTYNSHSNTVMMDKLRQKNEGESGDRNDAHGKLNPTVTDPSRLDTVVMDEKYFQRHTLQTES